MGDRAPLAKLWFQIPNTAALLICKYGATNANSSSGRKGKKKKRSSFLGFICQKSLQGEIAKCCTFCLWPKGNYCQKAFDSFWLYDVFQKKKKKKTAQISHHMLSIPRLQLGASEEILTFMRTTSLNPPSPHPSALLQALFCLQGRWQEKRRGCWVPSLVSTRKTFTLMRHF